MHNKIIISPRRKYHLFWSMVGILSFSRKYIWIGKVSSYIDPWRKGTWLCWRNMQFTATGMKQLAQLCRRPRLSWSPSTADLSLLFEFRLFKIQPFRFIFSCDDALWQTPRSHKSLKMDRKKLTVASKFFGMDRWDRHELSLDDLRSGFLSHCSYFF